MTCAIVPYTPVKHASSYYRCYEVAERSGMFRVFDGSPVDILFHQKRIRRDLLGRAKIHILDICDRLDFPDGFLGVDYITVTTEALAQYYRKRTQLPVHVLPEVLPIQGQMVNETSVNPKELHLCWFGLWHQEAPEFILKALDGLTGVTLTFMSHQEEPYRTYWHEKLLPYLKVSYRYVDWDWDIVQAVIGEADLTIIPTNSSKDWWQYKSPNRFVISVASGTPVLCSPSPAYKDLAGDLIKSLEDFPNAIRHYYNTANRQGLWKYQRSNIEPLLPHKAILKWDQLVEKILACQHQT